MSRHRILLRAITATLALLVPMTASAQDDNREQPAPAQTRSYAYQTLIADVASLGTIVVGATMKSDAGSTFGAAGYVFATPCIHGSHAKAGRAVGSFGMRVGAGAIALLYYQISKPGAFSMGGDQDAGQGGRGEIFGTLALLSIPVVVDLLGAEEEVSQPSSRSVHSLTLVPGYDIGSSTMQLQLFGRM